MENFNALVGSWNERQAQARRAGRHHEADVLASVAGELTATIEGAKRTTVSPSQPPTQPKETTNPKEAPTSPKQSPSKPNPSPAETQGRDAIPSSPPGAPTPRQASLETVPAPGDTPQTPEETQRLLDMNPELGNSLPGAGGIVETPASPAGTSTGDTRAAITRGGVNRRTT